MSLHTVPVTLSSSDAMRLLCGQDGRQTEGWCLLPESWPTSHTLRLALYIDSSPTAHAIDLEADGTWTLTTHITLGEKA